jgi:hypothetical protein
MTKWKRNPRSLRILLSLGASAVALFGAAESAMAQMSELDRYDRAVNSESSVEAVVFIRVFPASPLVDDLITSLPPDVALQVCADLDGGGPRLAQTACKQLQDPLAVAPASGVAAPVASTPDVRSGSTGSGEKCTRSPCTVVLLAPAGSVTQPADDAALADTSDTGDTQTGDSVGGTDAASGPGAGNDSGGAVAGSSTDGSVGGSTSGSVGGSTGGSVSGSASGDASGDVGGSTSGSTGGSVSGSASGDASGGVSGSTGGSVSGNASGDASGGVGDTASGSASGNASGGVSGNVGDTSGSVGASLGGSIGADSRGGIDADAHGGVGAGVNL